MTRSVTVSVPAKINLWLAVGPLRDDGFHELVTIYQAVGLYDDVRVREAEADTVTVEGDGVDVSDVPADGTNLALRACRLLAEHHGLPACVDLHVRKRIPVAGGLAGGSADAAAALVACDALWDLRTTPADLLRLAARLGSDVPFCLLGGTARGTGRGEAVEPVRTRGTYWWVLLPDQGGLSTPAVYAEHDRLGGAGGAPDVSADLLEALAAGDVVGLAAALRNDLQSAVLSLRPDLGDRLARGRDLTALGVLVSGSGPTTAYLCGSRDHAMAVARSVGPGALVAQAPAPGPRVVAG